MKRLALSLIALLGLTLAANAQCASGYTQLSNVFACQQNTTSAPVISSSSSASGTVGVAFSYQITASNSPTSFSATGLPAPLSVNTNTGLISGTPTGTFSGNITLGATNGSGTGNLTLALTISQPTSAPAITSSSTASGTQGMAFSYQITATNSPTSYSASGLPAPLTVNTNTGLITGTPNAAFSGNVTLGATNSSGTGNLTLALTISQSFTVGYTTIPSGSSYTSGETDCTRTGWVMPQNGVIQSVSMYFPTGNSATAGASLGVYGDTSGHPGSKLAETSSFTLPTTAGWVTVNTTTNPTIASGTPIYLCWAEPSGATMVIENDFDSANTTWYDSGVHNLPTTFSVSGSFANGKPGIYATFH